MLLSPVRWLAGLASAVVAVLTIVLYTALMSTAEPRDWGMVVAVALLIGGLGAAAVVGSLTRDPARRAGELVFTGVALLAFGFVTIFSIGLYLLLASAFSFFAASAASAEAARSKRSLLAAIAAVLLGLFGAVEAFWFSQGVLT